MFPLAPPSKTLTTKGHSGPGRNVRGPGMLSFSDGARQTGEDRTDCDGLRPRPQWGLGESWAPKEFLYCNTDEKLKMVSLVPGEQPL